MRIIGNNSVLHRTDYTNIFIRSAVDGVRRIADSNRRARFGIHRNHGRFVKHNAFAADIHNGRSGPEIDTDTHAKHLTHLP